MNFVYISVIKLLTWHRYLLTIINKLKYCIQFPYCNWENNEVSIRHWHDIEWFCVLSKIIGQMKKVQIAANYQDAEYKKTRQTFLIQCTFCGRLFPIDANVNSIFLKCFENNCFYHSFHGDIKLITLDTQCLWTISHEELKIIVNIR